MVITLTSELEQALNELAKKQGMTIESLALKTLQEHLPIQNTRSAQEISRKNQNAQTLADSLAGYVGVIDSGEIIEGGAQMSKNTGNKFADILLEKRLRGKL